MYYEYIAPKELRKHMTTLAIFFLFATIYTVVVNRMYADYLAEEAAEAKSGAMHMAAEAMVVAQGTIKKQLSRYHVELNGAWASDMACTTDSDLDIQVIVPSLDDMSEDELYALTTYAERATGFRFAKVLYQWDKDGSLSLGLKLEGISSANGYSFPTELVIRNARGIAPARLAPKVMSYAERSACRQGKRFYASIGPSAYKSFKKSLDQAILEAARS